MKQTTLDGNNLPVFKRQQRCLNCKQSLPNNHWSFCSAYCKKMYVNKKVKYLNNDSIDMARSPLLKENKDIANRITAGQMIKTTDGEIKKATDGNNVAELTDLEGNKWGTFAAQPIGFINGKFKEHLEAAIKNPEGDGALDLYFYEEVANTGRTALKVSLFKQ